ncbi:unnamed protein product [Arabidopsis halleri]
MGQILFGFVKPNNNSPPFDKHQPSTKSSSENQSSLSPFVKLDATGSTHPPAVSSGDCSSFSGELSPHHRPSNLANHSILFASHLHLHS